jgi:hypothetical protein
MVQIQVTSNEALLHKQHTEDWTPELGLRGKRFR